MRKFHLRSVILLSLIGFTMGILAVSFHHHDNRFPWPAGCSICKAKSSLSGIFHNVKVDAVSGMAGSGLLLTAINLCLSGFLPAEKTVFPDSQVFDSFPNKAPPFAF